MRRQMYRDENGLLRYRLPKSSSGLQPGAKGVWHKTLGLTTTGVPVTVIEDRGSWVIVEACDGRHRIKKHNLKETI